MIKIVPPLELQQEWQQQLKETRQNCLTTSQLHGNASE